MRVAVVGNGPSAKNQRKRIDSADFVVRCTWFQRAGAENAGTKLDAWAWFGARMQSIEIGRPPQGDYVTWFTLPPSRCYDWDRDHCGNLRNALEFTEYRPVRVISEFDWNEERKAIRSGFPSTGFTAIDMAVKFLPISKLELYGFDATNEDRPGWGDARHVLEWLPNHKSGHDLAAEKREINCLRSGKWLGSPVKFDFEWIHV